jgi:hypothetical protein
MDWCRFQELSPAQCTIEKKVLDRFYAGETTKKEMYWAMSYHGIPGMLECDVPY